MWKITLSMNFHIKLIRFENQKKNLKSHETLVKVIIFSINYNHDIHKFVVKWYIFDGFTFFLGCYFVDKLCLNPYK